METSEVTANRVTILVIEDDGDIRDFVSRVGEFEGYRVMRAADGTTGLAILRYEDITLIVLDLRLPELDGWAILEEIKDDPELVKIPVIVLTAIVEPAQRKKTLDMGVARYLTKPISAARLKAAIKSVLREQAGINASV